MINPLPESVRSVLIVLNGERVSRSILSELAGRADLVIAADGGCNQLIGTEIAPHIVLGDFDSLDPRARTLFPGAEFSQIEDQDLTDLQKALARAAGFNPDIIEVAGFSGLRSDHFLANVLTLMQFEQSRQLVFHDNFGSLEKISGRIELDAPPGSTVSLTSFLPLSGLSLSGFKYSLQQADYPNGFNGVSNVIVSAPATISVESGSLLLYTHRK